MNSIECYRSILLCIGVSTIFCIAVYSSPNKAISACSLNNFSFQQTMSIPEAAYSGNVLHITFKKPAIRSSDFNNLPIYKRLTDNKLRPSSGTIRHLNQHIPVFGVPCAGSISEKMSFPDKRVYSAVKATNTQKEKMLVVWKYINKKVTGRIDLNSFALFTSSYYLRSKELIYMELSKSWLISSSKFYYCYQRSIVFRQIC